MPAVSVILPTYNRSQYLEDAIKSVLAQSYTDFELVVVDDGSSDNTEEIIKSFADERIIYIRHQDNKGAAAARNTGIRYAKGEYIAFIDDDDVWLPAKLERLIDKISHLPEKVGVIYAWEEVRSRKDDSLMWMVTPKMKGNLKGEFLYGQKIGGIPFLIRKECFDKVGLFDESLMAAQDWDMLKRIADYYEFDFVPEVLTIVYRHKEQISTNLKNLIKGRERMIEKYKDEFLKYPHVLATHYKRLGKLYFINGTWRIGITWFAKAVGVNKLEIIKIIAWFIIDYPRIMLFGHDKDFKKYRIV